MDEVRINPRKENVNLRKSQPKSAHHTRSFCKPCAISAIHSCFGRQFRNSSWEINICVCISQKSHTIAYNLRMVMVMKYFACINYVTYALISNYNKFWAAQTHVSSCTYRGISTNENAWNTYYELRISCMYREWPRYAHIVCSDLFDTGFESRYHELLRSDNLYTSTCDSVL